MNGTVQRTLRLELFNAFCFSKMEQVQNQLRQHFRTVESLSSSEQDLQMELRSVKQRLAAANRQLLEREAEVKLKFGNSSLLIDFFLSSFN